MSMIERQCNNCDNVCKPSGGKCDKCGSDDISVTALEEPEPEPCYDEPYIDGRDRHDPTL